MAPIHQRKGKIEKEEKAKDYQDKTKSFDSVFTGGGVQVSFTDRSVSL